MRIIHYMSSEHGNGGGSVNPTTVWDEIPACALAGMVHDV